MTLRSHIAMPIRQLVRAGLTQVLPRRRYLVRGPRRSRRICLTFDDGPHPELTPQYLDLLAALGVRATFFLVGQNAEQFPELARRILTDGHAIGNHSYSHPNRGSVSRRQMAEDMRLGAEVIAAASGQQPTLYRPPRGAVTAADLCAFLYSNLTVVLWNKDPKDFACRREHEVSDWFSACPPGSGDIFLLHDVHPHSLTALPRLVAQARQAGLDFTTIDEWTGSPPK
jgi:peptidoglycan/xylan/chitin deacetylase (PgdA/CDA1 family)